MVARALQGFPWARLFPWLILAAGLSATFALRERAAESAQRDLGAHFEDQVQEIARRIQKSSAEYAKVLRGVALFAGTGPRRDEFRGYWNSMRMNESLTGVRSAGFAPIVRARDKTPRLAALGRQGYSGFAIHPEGEREFYAPIAAIEPQNARNQRLLGYDAYSNDECREAMERSREFNRSAISSRLKLMQGPNVEPEPGALMWLPVFRDGAAGDTVSGRSTGIAGWAFLAFSVGSFVRGSLTAQDFGIGLKIVEGEAASADALLYTTTPSLSRRPDRAPMFTATRRVEVGGRVWTVNAHSLPAFEADLDQGRVELMQQSGIALSLLAALSAWLLLSSRQRAQALAHELTRSLRESEARLNFALDGSGDGLWDWNVAEGTTFFSARWKAMLGYADAEIGTGMEEMYSRVHAEDRDAVMRRLRDALDRDDAAYESEFRVSCRDGSWKWVLERGMVVSRGEKRKPLRMIGTRTDMTKRRLEEDRLRNLMRAVEQSQVATLITDPEGRIEYVNPSFCRIAGYTPEETLGKKPSMLKSGLMPPAVYQDLWTTIKAGRVWKGELQNRRKNGEIYWESEVISAVENSRGEIVNFIAAKEDISERRRVAQTLSETEKRYRELFEANPQPMWVFALDTLMFLAVNDAAVAHYGYSRDEFLAMRATDLHPAEESAGLAPRVADERITNVRDAGIWQHRRKDGTLIAAEIKAHTLEFAGRPAQVVHASDVTARLQNEAAVLEIQRNLTEMVAERTAELHALALELLTSEARERRVIAEDLHDGLGQSLAVAKLKLTSLVIPGEGESRDDFLRQLRELEDTIDRSNATVRSLSTQLSPPVLYQFGLGAALEWLSEEMLRTYGLSVDLSLGTLPPLDETTGGALFRIVRELLINVWKHAEVSRADVTVSTDAASGRIAIGVTDAGVGFDVERLLKPSAENSFGLFSIKERVAFLGGTMRIDSKPDRGTAVLVALSPGSKLQTMIEGGET